MDCNCPKLWWYALGNPICWDSEQIEKNTSNCALENSSTIPGDDEGSKILSCSLSPEYATMGYRITLSDLLLDDLKGEHS